MFVFEAELDIGAMACQRTICNTEVIAVKCGIQNAVQDGAFGLNAA